MEELQVMGFQDVALALPRILRRFSRIRSEILRLNPAAVLCIDYPGFNLRLERSLRKSGYQGKLIHAVCPSVWAWGKKRIPMMARQLDLLLTLFPFEQDCFAKTGLAVTYIGHPLVSKIGAYIPSPDFHARYGLDPNRPLLALFPGSRSSVIERNLPLQLGAAQELQASFPDLQIALSIAHPERRSQLLSLAKTAALIEPESSYDLMRAARLALATSGTVTLELALFDTPAVVNYALRPLDRFLAEWIFQIRLPHYCIVNILAKRQVYPELIGPYLTVASLTEQAKNLWQESDACVRGCREVRALLGNCDAATAGAERILRCLGVS